MTETVQELDLSFEELEVLVGPDCAAVSGQAACDASLGGAIGLSLAFSVIAITVT
ncbi:MAG: hypothetical protein ACRDS0_05270 [Pseudonocardiaceae bacterium]